MTSLRLYRQDC